MNMQGGKNIELNIAIKRSFWSEAEEIWEICEPSKFPLNRCYTRVRSVATKAQRPQVSEANAA
jgi:hypothetical protein